MDVLQVHFTRLKCKHMQTLNITLHRETVYSDKIDPVHKCLKITRTAIFCLNKGPQLENTIRNYENREWCVLPAEYYIWKQKQELYLKIACSLKSTILCLFITVQNNQIPFQPFYISDLHHTLWQGIPQFNYTFIKQTFPFVGFKMAA